MNPGWYDWKQTWKKPDEPSETPGDKRAESEAATHDPAVNPETLQPTQSMSRRQKKAARLQGKERAQYKDDLKNEPNTKMICMLPHKALRSHRHIPRLLCLPGKLVPQLQIQSVPTTGETRC